MNEFWHGTRLVIIEVKLAGNAESRRAVVAQVLSYAGYLQGLDPGQLESQVLAARLGPAGWSLAAVEADDQQYGVDQSAFEEGLARALADGSYWVKHTIAACWLAGESHYHRPAIGDGSQPRPPHPA